MTDTTIIALPAPRWREYRALRLRALATDPQAFGSAYGEQVGYPDDYWQGRLRAAQAGQSLLLFAERDGALVGMLGAVWGDAADAPGTADIISVFVDAEARGAGVGAQLLDAALARLATRAELRAALLTVVTEQTAALRLYARAGFRVIATLRSVMGDGVERDEYVMERPFTR